MQGRYKSKRAEVFSALMRGKSAKEASIEAGMTKNHAHRIAAKSGLRLRYLLPQEWDNVLLARSATLTGRVRLTRKPTVTPATLRSVTTNV